MVWTRSLTILVISFISLALPCPAVRVSSSTRALLLDSAAPASPAAVVTPEKCGTLGNPCCPSTSNSSKAWYCKDGSTCIYFQLGDNSKMSKCEAIDKTCGTGPFTPCCPARYELGIEYNPEPAPGGNVNCPRGSFCDIVDTKNVCVPQPKKCGEFGQKCCVTTSRLGPYFKCAGADGGRGYCANPPGFKGTGDAPLRDLVCTKCPDKVDPNNRQMFNAPGARCNA